MAINKTALSPSAAQIKREIKAWVKHFSFLGVDYGRWYIGVTNNPKVRINAHRCKIKDEPYMWYAWYAYSKVNALAIERYFHELGMLETSHPGGPAENTRYVYVFKRFPTGLE
jgi:hypothetical protein